MQICTARGEASLAADRTPAAPGTANAGSMSRPGEEFVHDLQIVFVIEFVGRKDAEFASGFEEGDRNHQIVAEVEGMGLGEGKIVRHRRGFIRERANSRSMAHRKAQVRARSP